MCAEEAPDQIDLRRTQVHETCVFTTTQSLRATVLVVRHRYTLHTCTAQCMHACMCSSSQCQHYRTCPMYNIHSMLFRHRSPGHQVTRSPGRNQFFLTLYLHKDCLGSAGLGSAGLGSAGLGSAGLGSAGLGSAGLGSAGLGSAGLGSAGLGSAGLGNAGLGSASAL